MLKPVCCISSRIELKKNPLPTVNRGYSNSRCSGATVCLPDQLQFLLRVWNVRQQPACLHLHRHEWVDAAAR